MGIIKLNDILHLPDEELADAKIGLNMEWNNRSHFLDWYESDEKNRKVDFTYHAHQANRRNFTKIGQICIGFVRIPTDPDKWLLVSVGRITSLPDDIASTCDHEELPQFQALLGRLIVRYHKGNTFSRYIFNANPLINELEVSEILPSIMEPLDVRSLDEIHFPYSTLRQILDGVRYGNIRALLNGIKGVYCLTDTKTGKLYIGSAYGTDGLLQRWKNYIDSQSGGNKELVALLESEGEEYFREYFEFTLIEHFPKSTPKEDIIQRENFWKVAFSSRLHGYNAN